jgi:hypothetical protein
MRASVHQYKRLIGERLIIHRDFPSKRFASRAGVRFLVETI